MSDHHSNLRATHVRIGCMWMISRLHRAVCQLLPQPRWRRESLVLHQRGLQGRGDGLGLLRRVRRVTVSAAAVAQPATPVAVATAALTVATASSARARHMLRPNSHELQRFEKQARVSQGLD